MRFPLALVSLLLCAAAPLGAQTPWEYRQFIERDEGYSSTIYLDSLGNPTIGIGHKLTRADITIDTGPLHLSRGQIDHLFFLDYIQAYHASCFEVTSFPYQPRAARLIIVALVFNLGQQGFHQFVSFRAALNGRDYHAASLALANSLWARQLPQRAQAYCATLDSLTPQDPLSHTPTPHGLPLR